MNDVKTKSKVFYTDFRCKPDEGPADKLKRLIREFGIILKQNQLFCMFNGISLQCFGLIVIKAICCQRCNQIH